MHKKLNVLGKPLADSPRVCYVTGASMFWSGAMRCPKCRADIFSNGWSHRN